MHNTAECTSFRRRNTRTQRTGTYRDADDAGRPGTTIHRPPGASAESALAFHIPERMNHAQARADHDNREEDVAVVGSGNSRRPVCGGSRLTMPRLGGSEEDRQNRRTHRARKLLEGAEQGVAVGFQLGVHLVEALVMVLANAMEKPTMNTK